MDMRYTRNSIAAGQAVSSLFVIEHLRLEGTGMQAVEAQEYAVAAAREVEGYCDLASLTESQNLR
jgi:hypothetical protein